MSRAEAVQRAVELAGTRDVAWFQGRPSISEDSPREALIAFLVWNDGNGIWTDDDLICEGLEPMTLDEAWEAIGSLLSDAMD